jgi:hypothetical protein
MNASEATSILEKVHAPFTIEDYLDFINRQVQETSSSGLNSFVFHNSHYFDEGMPYPSSSRSKNIIAKLQSAGFAVKGYDTSMEVSWPFAEMSSANTIDVQVEISVDEIEKIFSKEEYPNQDLANESAQEKLESLDASIKQQKIDPDQVKSLLLHSTTNIVLSIAILIFAVTEVYVANIFIGLRSFSNDAELQRNNNAPLHKYEKLSKPKITKQKLKTVE